MLVFACLCPHPPLLLPHVGSPADRDQVKKTAAALKLLASELATTKPDLLVISSPHADWGFNVPLHFLSPRKGVTIKPYLTDPASPQVHFERGQKIAAKLPQKKRMTWIASGDLSHRLKKDGPYGFHPSGPKFDQKFISLLKQKNISGILNLPSRLVEEAGECGLRSFCMLLGALEKSGVGWQPKILSYEGPFGIGYLVARLL